MTDDFYVNAFAAVATVGLVGLATNMLVVAIPAFVVAGAIGVLAVVEEHERQVEWRRESEDDAP